MVGGSTVTFACYRGSDYFLNFAMLLGVEVLPTIFIGMPILAGTCLGMPFSTGIFLGVSLKMLILWCFFYIKYSNIFCFCLVNVIKIIFMKYRSQFRGISDCSALWHFWLR